MNPLIENCRTELDALCRRFRVDRLDVFGSGATERFDPAVSDLDFIVTFADRATAGYADRYLDFAEALESVFQRPVDLITERSIRNPIFQRAVAQTRQPIYDRRGEKAIA